MTVIYLHTIIHSHTGRRASRGLNQTADNSVARIRCRFAPTSVSLPLFLTV